MPDPVFLEDLLRRPFVGTMAWAEDGRGVEVCVDAQMIRYPASAEVADDRPGGGKVRLVDKIIRLRFERTGVRFVKRMHHCGGWHLYREDAALTLDGGEDDAAT